MDVKSYLHRIKCSEKHSPSLNALAQLQENHLLNIPFENIDIYNKVKIHLDNSYTKIVLHKRGGFCYELNGLFYQLLIHLGYHAKMVSARVFKNENEYGPEFDHMAIIAYIGKQDYLVDAGFGEFAFHPLPIQPDIELVDPRGIFKIVKHNDGYWLVTQKKDDINFIPEYIFSEKERLLHEFNEMCEYHQTSPESHFTQKLICSLPTKDGRITVSEKILKITSGGKTTENAIKSEKDLNDILKEKFGIQNVTITYRS